MMKLLLPLFLSLFILEGCATPQWSLSKADRESIRSVILANHEYLPLMKRTPASEGHRAVGGLIGNSMAASVEAREGKVLTESFGLPDFGSLIFDGFVERFQREFPNWPWRAEKTLIDDEYHPSDSSTHLLTLHVISIHVSNSCGLSTMTIAKMLTPKGSVVWEKGYQYRTKDFSRLYSLQELEADNGKLLKQELAIAAERTVSDLILHLKGGPSARALPDPSRLK